MTSPVNLRTEAVAVGIDVGSTTVKAVVVDPVTKEILWSDYLRHQTKQAEFVLSFLERIAVAFPNIPTDQIRTFITGSGGAPIGPHIGSKFVQEVNAVTLAVETLHPDVGSVCELGGQDAKIIIFKKNEETGGKTAITSMNDKCASGTGATIDKCVIKVGLPNEEVVKIGFDDSKLHHVAAKCGVFAETDIVNLVKNGIPSLEIMNSLADAIVMQNLSVLTRGNTLRHKVLLLGGPNTYLPFLRDCWRKRIPETWRDRGYAYPKDVPIEELIIVPENAQYYAAYGAVVYGLYENANVGVYKGMDGLKDFILNGRAARLGETAGPPLLTQGADHGKAELDEFKKLYTIPKFQDATFAPGQVVKVVIGMDGGSTSSKAVLIDYDSGELLKKSYMLSKGNPIADTKEILAGLKKYITDQGAIMEVMGFGATGYAADVLKESVKSDTTIVETVAHMMSATHYFGDIDVVCDIGGQDIKVLFMQNGDIRNFRLSNQCSAGNGMLLQAMADQFGVKVTDYADVAFEAKLSPKFSYGCAVFLDSDRVNFQKEGFSKEELLAGLAQVLPKNVWQYVVQIPRMAELGKKFVLQGGTQHNLAALKAQVDYIKARVPGAEVFVHPHTGEAGAIGAAMETRRVVMRKGSLDLHRHRRRHQPRVPGGQRRVDALPLLPQQLRPHLHRHQDARRADLALHLGLLLREGDGRVRRGDDRAQQGAQEADEGVPEPGRLRVEAGLPALLRSGADAGGDAGGQRRGGREGLPLPGREEEDHPAQLQPLDARVLAGAPHGAGRDPQGPQQLDAGAVLPHLPGDAGPAEAEHRLLRRDLRGDVAEGRQVRVDRSLLPVEGRAGPHPQPALRSPPAGRGREEAQVPVLPLHHPRHAGPEQADGHGVLPHRRGRARGHEGGLHQGDRLLRRARDHLRRSGAHLHRALAAQEPALRVLGPAARRDRGRERLRLPAGAGRRWTSSTPICRRRGARSSRRSRRRTAWRCS